jgi:precorrin-3B C17-methyltransferase
VLADKRAEPPVVAVAPDGSAVVPLLGGLTGAEPLAARIAAALGIAPASTAAGATSVADAASAGADPAPGRGRLAILGLGPGDPAWLTPEASQALDAATDIVGYGTYLELCTPRPGQRLHASDNRVEMDRARQALRLAREGRAVALVSSGDPGIFAMAAAVMEAVEADGAELPDIRVVPGVSAMQAAAARVGAPLGHDFAVVSLSDIRKPWDVIEARLRAAAAADFVLALYNPASTARREQIARAKAVLLEYRTGATPVVAARDVGRAGERVSVTELGALDPAAVDMRTVLIVGSSRTRRFATPEGRVFVYAPRSHATDVRAG